MKYYPYLRGKQFELIALREMCSFMERIDIVSPIIEPVKKGNTTLVKTIECLKEKGINFNLIFNPQDGEITQKESGFEEFIDYVLPVIGGYKNYQPSFIINERTNIPWITSTITNRELQNITLIFTQLPQDEAAMEFLSNTGLISNFILLQTDSSVRRLSRRFRTVGNIIMLEDKFNLKQKNADYADPDDEPFSEDHLYFEDEGYSGFSDYLTIGNVYNEGGFLPYAVAIHLTYFAEDNIRVHHFVSDSNDDNEDVPGKVAEALAKLIPFIDAHGMNTTACNQFRHIQSTGAYPGLGPIKKLSILNHIEIIYDFFTR